MNTDSSPISQNDSWKRQEHKIGLATQNPWFFYVSLATTHRNLQERSHPLQPYSKLINKLFSGVKNDSVLYHQGTARSGSLAKPSTHVVEFHEDAPGPKIMGTRREEDDVVLKNAEAGSNLAEIRVLNCANKPTLLYSAAKQTHLVLRKNSPFAMSFGSIFRINDSVDVEVTYSEANTSRDLKAWFAQELEEAKSEIARLIEEVTCYICWNTEESTEEDFVVSPCGNCTGSSRYVHLSCLLQWIDKNRLGHCPICKDAIPEDFGPRPPYIELTVLDKHVFRRNIALEQNIVRISLANRDKVYLGTKQDGSLVLVESQEEDRDNAHCYVTYDAVKHDFFIVDCAEDLSCKTMLKLNNSHEIALEELPTRFLIGRGDSRCIADVLLSKEKPTVVVQESACERLLANSSGYVWFSLVALLIAFLYTYM